MDHIEFSNETAVSSLVAYKDTGNINFSEAEILTLSNNSIFSAFVKSIMNAYESIADNQDIDIRQYLIDIHLKINEEVRLRRLNNIENMVHNRMKKNADEKSDTLLKVFFLKSDSKFKWLRFCLMNLLFVGLIVIVFGFWAFFFSALINFETNSIYYIFTGLGLFTLVSWLPVLKEAYMKLKLS